LRLATALGVTRTVAVPGALALALALGVAVGVGVGLGAAPGAGDPGGAPAVVTRNGISGSVPARWNVRVR
jgi:hypothetical protein